MLICMIVKRNFNFYMANLGAEVERIFYWREKKDFKEVEFARARAASILEKIATSHEISGREKEFELLRESIFDIASTKQKFNIDISQMRVYFTPFALRAMQ